MARISGEKDIYLNGIRKIFILANKNSNVQKTGTYSKIILLGIIKN